MGKSLYLCSRNQITIKIEQKMEILTEQEMQRVLGGGYWIYLTEQGWIYVDENDEENDDTDIIYVG